MDPGSATTVPRVSASDRGDERSAPASVGARASARARCDGTHCDSAASAHVVGMRTAIFVAFLSMVACVVEEDAPAIDRGGEDPMECENHGDQVDCLEAGCRWQTLYGVAFTSDGSCEIGPPWGLCYPSSFAQPCDEEALLCDEGMHAWVLPGPDNAVVMTLSATSCGLPDYFMPCEEPSYRENLAAPASASPHSIVPDDEDELLARACECGCAGPQ